MVRTKYDKICQLVFSSLVAAAQAEDEREPTPFNELVFDSREHYERSKRCSAWIFYISGTSISREDAYDRNLVQKNIGALDMRLVLAIIALPGMRWDSYKPKSGRVNNAILTPQARGW
ncbi:hypothetical protein PIB30_092741 [Stylosanthes scabra]|uniref:Uncharacterized protein n=1 Tax=Stylosanthes scabra TaxID=79078 RepID=A0ABU6VTE1_9FABA|nr:hypothetical protein [Stylosanthes scabra]